MATAAAKIVPAGDNRPPLVTADQLGQDFKHLTAESDELAAKCDTAPTVVEDDEDLGILRELARQLLGAHKRAEAIRVETKEPYLAAERVVDSHFTRLKLRLAGLQAGLERRAKIYLDKKEAQERARREEIARQEREAAARKAEEARLAVLANKPVEAAVAHQQAAQADNRALDAQRAAEAKPADLVRTPLPGGGSATLRQEWDFEITDIAKVDLEVLRSHIPQADIKKAIGRFVDTHKGDRELPGVRIFQKTSAQFR